MNDSVCFILNTRRKAPGDLVVFWRWERLLAVAPEWSQAQGSGAGCLGSCDGARNGTSMGLRMKPLPFPEVSTNTHAEPVSTKSEALSHRNCKCSLVNICHKKLNTRTQLTKRRKAFSILESLQSAQIFLSLAPQRTASGF